tara:strand:- start:1443 stop:1946 length:504 start_codon:yes stop_codon:yes gene_type:complete
MSKLFVDEIASKTGTADALTIDSSGRVGLSNPILFWGQLSATAPFAPTASDLLSFSDYVDTASGWNSSNKYYVVPKAGYYEVHCMLLSNSQTTGLNIDFRINKNASLMARGYTSVPANSYQPAVVTTIQPLAANDQISIQVGNACEIWAGTPSGSPNVSSLSIKFLG